MKKNIFIMVSLMALLLSSCSIPHYYYSSNIQNVPLFKQKNEFSGLIAGSTGVENQYFELQGGYALPAHIALTGSFMTGGNNSSTSTYTDFSKNTHIEGALGYYTSLNSTTVFEVFAGYGQGSQRHVFAHNEYQGNGVWEWVPDGDAQLTLTKLFIQPDFGIKKDWFEAGFSARLSILNFDKVNFQNTVSHLDELTFLHQNNSSMLLEPAVTIRAGGKTVKGQIQIGYSHNLTSEIQRFEKLKFGFGVYVNFSKKQVEK